jgi:hypothetical protein
VSSYTSKRPLPVVSRTGIILVLVDSYLKRWKKEASSIITTRITGVNAISLGAGTGSSPWRTMTFLRSIIIFTKE